MSLFATLLVLSFSPSVFAQGGPPAAGGTVKVTNTVANANGTYTFSGTYGSNANWAPATLMLYLSHDVAAGNKVLDVPGPALAGNTWTITTPAIAGAFTCWLLYEITEVGTGNTQFITAPLKNIIAAGPGAGQPAPTNTLTWAAAGAIGRNVAGQIVGNGNYTLAAVWTWGTSPSSEMMCLPVGGGFVDSSPLAFVAKARTWSTASTFAFLPNDKYNVITWSEATFGGLTEVTATSFQLGK